ncbi:chondroitin proteoglycan-2 [Patella vulgata]|uniref:chondroitin proteoglycan-2 n=1 Tax=Patella vulgata TaxID=6465 RepID=UPI0021807B72|nr:chondroitin proteoglycan-2 [Patella vulgata]
MCTQYSVIMLNFIIYALFVIDAVAACENGEYHPHSTDCNKFLQCSNGVLVEQTCASGLHWSVQDSRCEQPADAGCTTSSETCTNEEFRPHSTDCTKYLQCSNGVLVEQTCASGLHWSVQDSRCEQPADAGCTTSSETCTNEELRPHSTDCTKFLQCSNGVLVEQTCASGLHWSVQDSRCEQPADAGCTTSSETCTNEELRPHSTDCTKFLQCSNGVLVEQTCASGLHWSVQDSRCEQPADAGCTTSSETCTNEELRPHSTDCNKFLQCSNGVLVEQTCASGLHWSVQDSRCEQPADAGCTTSSETCTNEEFRPHSTDCTKYLQCSNGVLVEQTCASGLHWSVQDSRCEQPADAGCTTSSETCTNEELRPHSTDCTKFLQCSNGVQVEQTCASGLHWSVQDSRCEQPADAGCTTSSETCTNEELRPHSTDCTKFLQCSNGVLVEQTCASGLHWSVQDSRCEQPADANCNPSTRK